MEKPGPYLAVYLLIIIALTISSCRFSPSDSLIPETEQMVTSAAPMNGAFITPYPAPSEQPQGSREIGEPSANSSQATRSSISDITPYPEPPKSAVIEDTPIENPTASSATLTPSGGYPGPEDNEFVTPTTTTSAGSSPYPGPTTDVVGNNLPTTPYPASGSSNVPTDTPFPVLPTSTPIGVATATISPTPTITPVDVSTRLTATDPDTFMLVAGRVQLVEFFAFWSPISKSMAPVVHRLENKYETQLQFVYLDIDDPANNLFAVLMGERLPPVFYLLDEQGEVLGEWEGYMPYEQFDQEISNALLQGSG
jgi:thiol-disulfide isomerase/thioredoxin